MRRCWKEQREARPDRTGRRRGWRSASSAAAAAAAAASSRFLPLLLPLPATLLAAMGRAGSLQGPPAPRRAFEEPRDGSGPCAEARRGGAGGGRWGVPDSGKERGGGNTPDQCSIPRGRWQPRGPRARAPTHPRRTKPGTPLLRPAAPPPAARAAVAGSTCTLPGSRAHPDPRGGRGPRRPGGPR